MIESSNIEKKNLKNDIDAQQSRKTRRDAFAHSFENFCAFRDHEISKFRIQASLDEFAANFNELQKMNNAITMKIKFTLK